MLPVLFLSFFNSFWRKEKYQSFGSNKGRNSKGKSTRKTNRNEKRNKINNKKIYTSKEKIRELNIDFNGNLSNEETYKFIGISRKTFYKYKAEMRQEDFLKEQSKKSNK